jgi:hypothetical protein
VRARDGGISGVIASEAGISRDVANAWAYGTETCHETMCNYLKMQTKVSIETILNQRSNQRFRQRTAVERTR